MNLKLLVADSIFWKSRILLMMESRLSPDIANDFGILLLFIVELGFSAAGHTNHTVHGARISWLVVLL